MNDDLQLDTQLTTTSLDTGLVTAATIHTSDILSIYGSDNVKMVIIHKNGQLEYGPNYDPDEAAKIFWTAVARYVPCYTCSYYHNSRKDNQK